MAEGAPLLRVYTLMRIEGSNPSLSAIHLYLGLMLQQARAGKRIGFEPSIQNSWFDHKAAVTVRSQYLA